MLPRSGHAVILAVTMAIRSDFIFSAIILAGLAAAAITLGENPRPRNERMSGSAIYVIDGDTVALPCAPYPCKSEHLRLVDIDAPETRKPTCEAEEKAGSAAKARLVLLLRGKEVEIERMAVDIYGRTLGHLTVEGHEIGQILLSEGFVLPMRSGSDARAKKQKHWCGGDQ